MNYIMDKEHYLSMQVKLYDKLDNILKSKSIKIITYNTVNHNILAVPDDEVLKNKKFTANINPWMEEILFSLDEIVNEILFCFGYYNVYNKYELEGISKWNIHMFSERHLKAILYNLFSIREKLRFLMFELFNRSIKINKHGKFKYPNKRDVAFNKIIEGLEYIDYAEEEFKWITEDEMSIIKEILTKNFNNQTCKKVFNDLRHPLVHRSNPGIDCMPLLTYEFQVREIENTKYTVVSTSDSEVTYDFEKIKADILYVWNKFVDGFEELFSKIAELNKEVNNLKVKM